MEDKRWSLRRGLLARAVTLLAFILSTVRLTVLAEVDVATTYGQAMSAYQTGSYDQAGKYLDSLESLDLKASTRAEVCNLRAIILMHECDYEGAETFLRQALEVFPSLSNAKFNLAELSFLNRDWVEARSRFQRILVEDSGQLESDVRQLIRFKIFLTFLLEREDRTAEQIMKDWEPTSPAAYYAHAAIARNHNRGQEAKKWLAAAETKFGAAEKKLYLESFYEIGWDQRPITQQRQVFGIASADEDKSGSKSQARKILAEGGDNRMPILSEETYNLADTYVKLRQFGRARDQLEKLFATSRDAQTEQFVLYKVFLTFLLEGSDSEATLLMKRFNFTDGTPAFYYARGAWAFAHGDSVSGYDWIESAERIYSPELNAFFLDDFYHLHWLDPNRDQISSTRISLGASLSDTLPVQWSPITVTTASAAPSNPDPVFQFLAQTGAFAIPSH